MVEWRLQNSNYACQLYNQVDENNEVVRLSKKLVCDLCINRINISMELIGYAKMHLVL
jgi:hypothetical protein